MNKDSKTAAPEKGPVKLKGLMSSAVKVEIDKPKMTPPNRGPMTGMSEIGDAEFLALYARPEELATFRASVEGRREREGTCEWRTLPDGSRIHGNMVLAGCLKCHAWMWVRPEHLGENCVKCNLQNRADGGKLRRATAEEEKAWFTREEAAREKWIADAPKRKAELNAFNRRLIQDGKL